MNIAGGSYWGLRIGSGRFLNRTFYAITPKMNSLSVYTTGITPKGTLIEFGLTGPQGALFPGLLPQFYVKAHTVIHQASKFVK